MMSVIDCRVTLAPLDELSACRPLDVRILAVDEVLEHWREVLLTEISKGEDVVSWGPVWRTEGAGQLEETEA